MGDEAACPKCDGPHDSQRTHCARCGLAHANMAAFQKQRDAVPDALAEAWKRATEGWEDRARHDELLRLVTQHDAYAWAAARYRDHIRDHADDAVAREHLDRVRRAAEATLMSSAAARKDKTPEPYRATMAVLALLMIIIVAGLVYAIARGGSSGVQRERAPETPGATK